MSERKEEHRDVVALNEAQRLAKVLHSIHYPDVENWKVAEDIVGVVLQIDNMVAGLVRMEDYPAAVIQHMKANDQHNAAILDQVKQQTFVLSELLDWFRSKG